MPAHACKAGGASHACGRLLEAPLTGWEGERMNYEWALETLCG